MARGDRSAFSVDDRAYSWRDAVEWARGSGELAALARETAAGLAALERSAPAADDVREAGAAFRYARGLLAADEMETWLARWELTTDQWLAHLRRTLAGDRLRGSEPQSPAPGGPRVQAPPEALSGSEPQSPAGLDEDAVWVDALCSGALERWAFELAARLAVSPGADVDEAAYAGFCKRAVTDAALAQEIERRRLEWLRVEGEQLELDDEDVAREVALGAREDGDSLAELARRARTELRPLAAYLDDLKPELASALLGGRERDVLGPLSVDGRFLVVTLSRKLAPSADDPELRARAAEVVLRRALEREVESRVRWHERL